MAASGFSHYCRNHRARLRRHGAVDQTGITATDLRPYVERVRQRIEKNAASSLWRQLDARWLALADHASGVIGEASRGRAGPEYERKAAREVLKLIAETEPRSVVEVALAMFLIWDQEPRRFRTDEGFRFQLVRRVRALGDVSAGERFELRSGRMKKVYRELSPRAVAVLGQWLADALGAAGVRLAQLEKRDEEKARSERLKFYDALGDLT